MFPFSNEFFLRPTNLHELEPLKSVLIRYKIVYFINRHFVNKTVYNKWALTGKLEVLSVLLTLKMVVLHHKVITISRKTL